MICRDGPEAWLHKGGLGACIHKGQAEAWVHSTGPSAGIGLEPDFIEMARCVADLAPGSSGIDPEPYSMGASL